MNSLNSLSKACQELLEDETFLNKYNLLLSNLITTIKNGNTIFSKKLPFIGSAPPTTYIANNEQYIIIHSTGGKVLQDTYPDIVETGNALVAFKLN